MNKRLRDLDNITGVTIDNYLLVDDSTFNSSKKLSIDNLKTYILSGVTDTSGYLKIDQTTPQTTIGTFTFPDVIVGNSGITILNDKITQIAYDNSNPEEWYTQNNGLWLDGDPDTDKQIVITDDTNDSAWSLGTYRNEKGNFIYLNSDKAEIIPLTISKNGRIGICKQTDTLYKYASQTSGSGLTDIEISGVYTKLFTAIYEINMSTPSGNDRFRWRKSTNNGRTYGSYSSLITINGEEQLIENGIYIKFDSVTGHTNGDTWRFAAFPQLPSGTFTVSPDQFSEVYTVTDYSSPVYINVTAEANSSMLDRDISCLGTTTAALYLGAKSPCPEMFFNIKQTRTGANLVVEYLTITGWTTVTSGMDLIDETSNFTISGSIRYTPSLLTGWSEIALVDESLYWMRIRTSTTPSGTFTLNNIAKHGNRRLAVFAEFNDPLPSFYVDSLGRVSVGGANIPSNNTLLQIAPKNSSTGTVMNVSSSLTSALMEIDSDNGNRSDFLFRLSSGTAISAPGILRMKSSGSLETPSNISSGHILGWDVWGGYINGNWRMTAYMQGEYTGATNNYDTDLSWWLSSGTTSPIRRITIKGANGNMGINTSTPQSKLQVNGGIQCGDDSDSPSLNKVGTTRYRSDSNNSYCEMCMQTGASTYEWVVIKTNTW